MSPAFRWGAISVRVDLRVRGVGEQHHRDVGLRDRVRGVHHREAGLLGLRAARRAGAEADAHVVPRVLQVLRVRVSLRSVAEHRDLLAGQRGYVGVLLVIDRRHPRPPRVPSLAPHRGPRRRRRRSSRAGPRRPRPSRPAAPFSLDPPLAARERDPPGPRQLHDPVLGQQLAERLELLRLARGLDRERRLRDVDDAHPEDLGDLHDPRAGVAAARGPSAASARARPPSRVVLEDLDHVDQLVQLLRDLLQGLRLDVDRRSSSGTGPRTRSGRPRASRC